jgi:mannose-6-phosphate isomerase-like protein (cupin superfamily)
MHKKSTLSGLPEGGYLVGARLAQESGFHCDKVEVLFLKLDPKDYPGKLHVHEKMDEIVVVLKGKFTVGMDNERIELAAGDYVFKTAGSAGRVAAADPDTEILIIKAPSVTGDVVIK